MTTDFSVAYGRGNLCPIATPFSLCPEICHFDWSEAEWRNLRFQQTPNSAELREAKLKLMMKTLHSYRIALVASIALLAGVPRAHAVSKEIIQLQTQVQQIQDMLNQMQQGNAERMGVLQHLVEQTADSVNKMSVTVNALDQTVRTQNEATRDEDRRRFRADPGAERLSR